MKFLFIVNGNKILTVLITMVFRTFCIFIIPLVLCFYQEVLKDCREIKKVFTDIISIIFIIVKITVLILYVKVFPPVFKIISLIINLIYKTFNISILLKICCTSPL